MASKGLVAGLAALAVAATCSFAVGRVDRAAAAIVPPANSVTAHGAAPALPAGAGMDLAQPLVGIAATPTGRGYWLAAADGGIFSFGDAPFLGAAAGLRLGGPVVGIAAADGRGYWLVTAVGGVSTFGTAPFFGSDAGLAGAPTVGIAGLAGGYWLLHGQATEPLGPGTGGPAVARLQQRLQDLGYWLGGAGVDGRYGALTVQAVYAFQTVAGLTPDGVVGAATAAALDRAVRPIGSTGGNLIEIDKRRQVLLVVRAGQVLWAFNTSTGTGQLYWSDGVQSRAITPDGWFSIYRQVDGYDVSPLGVLYRPKYVVSGIAIHGYPSVPPYPASHGCIRVTDAAMDFLWASGLAPIGEAVWIHG